MSDERLLFRASVAMVMKLWYQSLLTSAVWYNPSGPEIVSLILKIAECDDRIKAWTNQKS